MSGKETLFVTVRVEVSTERYSFANGCKSGEAMVQMELPRSILENLDPGNIVLGALKTALTICDAANPAGNVPDEDEDVADELQ